MNTAFLLPTQLELGEPTRKGIAVTRSFGNPVTTWLEMREALASYATRAAEKMRRYKVAADNLFVFMHTNTFNNDPFYSNGATARFSATTNDTGEVVALAVRTGERLFRDGFGYAKCGVMITELLPETVSSRRMGRAGPRTERTRLEDGGPAQCHAGAGNRPHPERPAERRGLATASGIPVTALDYAVGRAAASAFPMITSSWSLVEEVEVFAVEHSPPVKAVMVEQVEAFAVVYIRLY